MRTLMFSIILLSMGSFAFANQLVSCKVETVNEADYIRFEGSKYIGYQNSDLIIDMDTKNISFWKASSPLDESLEDVLISKDKIGGMPVARTTCQIHSKLDLTIDKSISKMDMSFYDCQAHLGNIPDYSFNIRTTISYSSTRKINGYSETVTDPLHPNGVINSFLIKDCKLIL